MNNSYWKFKKTSPIKWLTNELSFYIERWDNDSEEVRKEHIKFLLNECAFFEKDYELAQHYFRTALRLNPNITFAWAMSAATCNYLGDSDTALQHLQRYTALSSFDPNAYFGDTIYTTTYVLKGDYEEAYRFGKRAVRACPDFSNGYKHLLATLGHLSRRDEAAPYLQKLLQLEPHFTIARFIGSYPLARPEDRENYARGLELAGVPKG